MKYFRVKKEFDNTQKINKKAHLTRYHYKNDIWIGGELYTIGEVERLRKNNIIIDEKMFDFIEIPKNKTYFFFGARFAEE